jgi:hypothetical protein
VDARSRGFSEQETTAVLPFHQNQRLNDAVAASDDTTYAVSQNPTQLFTILPGGSAGSSGHATLPSVTATDLLDFFPRYYGDLKLQVVGLEMAFPGCAAVIEPEAGTVLVVDAARSTVQSLVFNPPSAGTGGGSDGGGSSGSLARGWGMGSSREQETGYRVCKDLAAGGEVVLYRRSDSDGVEEGNAAVHILDLLAGSATTITLPVHGGTVVDVMIPSRDAWIVTVEPQAGGFGSSSVLAFGSDVS